MGGVGEKREEGSTFLDEGLHLVCPAREVEEGGAGEGEGGEGHTGAGGGDHHLEEKGMRRRMGRKGRGGDLDSQS